MDGFRAALITGASSGIGESFAKALAEQGLDLVLVARSEDKLNSLARQLREVYERRVEVVATDLSRDGAAEKVRTATAALDLPIDLLINNAGFGTVGAFHKLDPARERQEVLLNAAGVVDMTRAFLPAMLERRRGGIINVASMAAFQAMPYMTTYAATKAFVLAFTEGLRGEVARKGVDVLCVCPGPVDTPFFEATGSATLRTTIPKFSMMTPEGVVAASLRAFRLKQGVVVPGLANKALAATAKLTPHWLLTPVMSRIMKR